MSGGGTKVINTSGMSYPANNEDRITNLPDCLISHILSSLPTRDAVRTSVLSKVWEYKWTSISRIDIHGCADEPAFVNFMERLLLHALDIKHFYIKCRVGQESIRLTSWLSALLRCKIETFCLRSHCFVIPCSLLNGSSLRTLSLDSACFKVPANICFPNLRSLKLYYVEILNDNPNSNHLIFIFLVLEILEMYFCDWRKVKFVEIKAPELITFSSDGSANLEKDDYSIKIIGDKLKEITTGGFLENIIVSGSHVAKASLYNIGNERDIAKRGECVRRLLLRGLPCLVDLTLGDYPIQAMAHSRDRLPFSTFEKLTKLDLCTPNSEGFLELLHALPSLKDLSLSITFSKGLWDKYEDYEAEPVPCCIVSCLETVRLSCCVDRGLHYLYLAKFILMNGAQLKMFQVDIADGRLSIVSFGSCRPDEVLKDEVRKNLSTIPTVSTCLEIIVC